jgi:hypothetical protein
MYRHLPHSFQAAKTCRLVAVALLLSACRTSGHGRPATAGSSPKRSSGAADVRAHNLITESELTSFPALQEVTAYDAVRKLRPEFLMEKPANRAFTRSVPVVIVDGARQGGPEVLRTLRASCVSEIRYYDAAEAYSHFGRPAATGAIVVKLAKR